MKKNPKYIEYRKRKRKKEILTIKEEQEYRKLRLEESERTTYRNSVISLTVLCISMVFVLVTILIKGIS